MTAPFYGAPAKTQNRHPADVQDKNQGLQFDLVGVRVHSEPTQQQSPMVAMVMSCDVINPCHDDRMEHYDIIMMSSDHSKLCSTHVIPV